MDGASGRRRHGGSGAHLRGAGERDLIGGLPLRHGSVAAAPALPALCTLVGGDRLDHRAVPAIRVLAARPV